MPFGTNTERVAIPSALRQDMVEKAVGFLTHPQVQETTLARKRDFLRGRRGLLVPKSMRRSVRQEFRKRVFRVLNSSRKHQLKRGIV